MKVMDDSFEDRQNVLNAYLKHSEDELVKTEYKEKKGRKAPTMK